MAGPSAPEVNLYPLSNYTFGTKDPVLRRDINSKRTGMTNSVGAILLVHEQNYPHVLLLQEGDNYALPGGKLKPGENDIDGLKRKLCSKLSVDSPSTQNWQIGECVSVWRRPYVDSVMYPYPNSDRLIHVESKNVYLVHLSVSECFSIRRNLMLIAVPFFELYGNDQVWELFYEE